MSTEFKLVLGLIITIIVMITINEIKDNEKNKFPFIVDYNQGYNETYSYTDEIRNNCISTYDGRICGCFQIRDNPNFKENK